jgi:hypothetical protein
MFLNFVKSFFKIKDPLIQKETFHKNSFLNTKRYSKFINFIAPNMNIVKFNLQNFSIIILFLINLTFISNYAEYYQFKTSFKKFVYIPI